MDYSPPGFSVHGFPKQKYWSGLPSPSPEDLLDSGIEPVSPALTGRFLTLSHHSSLSIVGYSRGIAVVGYFYDAYKWLEIVPATQKNVDEV